MLSQINAARGDESMQVDEESSEESEEEVHLQSTFDSFPLTGIYSKKSFTLRAHWNFSRLGGV